MTRLLLLLFLLRGIVCSPWREFEVAVKERTLWVLIEVGLGVLCRQIREGVGDILVVGWEL